MTEIQEKNIIETVVIWNREDWAFGMDPEAEPEWFEDVVYKVKLKDLPEGTTFIKAIPEKMLNPEYNKFPRVFVREEFDRSEKKYYCSPWEGGNDYPGFFLAKGETIVFTGFTF